MDFDKFYELIYNWIESTFVNRQGEGYVLPKKEKDKKKKKKDKKEKHVEEDEQ
jgi:hypothetical protein